MATVIRRDMTETRPQPRTIAGLAEAAAERFGTRLAARHKLQGEWRDLTFSEAAARIDALALGLVASGIEPGDRVAILSNTRLEWTLISGAIAAAGAVVVTVYPTNAPTECAWVLGDSGTRMVICEDVDQAAKIAGVRDRLPELEHVVLIEPAAGARTLDDLVAAGAGADDLTLKARQQAISPGDPYTIIYTSGTTGPPKGTVLTHANALSVCDKVARLGFIQEGETIYLYLPLAHIYALSAQLAAYGQGATIVYFGGDTTQILAELIETKPTYIPSVPRIFEKLYAAAQKLQAQGSEEDQLRFAEAIKLGVHVRGLMQRGDPVPAELQEAFARADERLYQRVQGLFGGRVTQAISGAAPIAAEILEFFYACGVPVLEGWGMTETTAVATVNTLDAFKFGTVGRPMPGVEVRIAPDDGEILLRGDNVFREYWNNPEATAETLVDGWLHTGDLGELDDDGYLKITGRKKDIIITAGGKNLTPANIENDLKRSPFISQAVMHGDRRPYPVALITLDLEEVLPWAAEQGLPQDAEQLAAADQVVALVQAEVDRANANYAQAEQIKRFAILTRDLSIEDGELTPTLKVKRTVVNERYAKVLDSLYG
jgi:long-chain acyl-CoA synthetase